jgi:hypothetical protein
MLNVILLIVLLFIVLLDVVMLSVVLLNVVAPFIQFIIAVSFRFEDTIERKTLLTVVSPFL